MIMIIMTFLIFLNTSKQILFSNFMNYYAIIFDSFFNKMFEMLSQAVAVAKIREAIAEARREAESQVR